MAQVIDLASASAPPPLRADGFVMTPTAQDVFTSLRLLEVLDGPAMTMIAGAPGTGKTRAIRAFEADANDEVPSGRPRVLLLTVCSGLGAPRDVIRALARTWMPHDRLDNRSLNALHDFVLECICDLYLLIFDGAQHLMQQDLRKTKRGGTGLEWVRSFCDATGCKVAFVGDRRLAEEMTQHPQITSRLRRPVHLARANPEDVDALLSSARIEDDAAHSALRAVASLAGGLRNVETTLQLARLMHGPGRIGGRQVADAIAELGLTPRGSKR